MQTFIEAELYVVVLVFILLVSHIFKEHNILSSALTPLYKVFQNSKLAISIMTALTGILPVPGRILITSATLDNITDKKTKELGVLSYLTSHHYYLWSPIEKSILVCMAGLGLTYGEIVYQLMVPIMIYLIYTYVYIYRYVGDVKITVPDEPVSRDKLFDLGILFIGILVAIVRPEVVVYSAKTPMLLWVFLIVLCYLIIRYSVNIHDLIKSLDMKMVVFVGLVIAASTVVKAYDETLRGVISGQTNILAGLLIAFTCSLLLGSSSKFAGITVVATTIFGMEYFVLFYIVDYIGYLLSPTHKCITIAKLHFNVPLGYFYKVVTILCSILGLYCLLDLYL